MSDPSDNAPQARFHIEVPENEREGSYANFLSVWHTQHDFTLDFAVMDTPRPETQEMSPLGPGLTVPCKVVSRVRIPATAADDVLRALAQNVTDFEQTVGRINRPNSDPTGPLD